MAGRSEAASIAEARDILETYYGAEYVNEIKPFGNGHINTTFLASVDTEAGQRSWIVQRINRHVFLRPERIMDNIARVTGHMRRKIEAEHGDPGRETLTVVKTKSDAEFCVDAKGEYWRVLLFIENTVTIDVAQDPLQLYECGKGFGMFQNRLSDFPGETLWEVIPAFHDTAARYETFLSGCRQAVGGRADHVKKEIAFVQKHFELCDVLPAGMRDGRLPIRVTHNDTKVNNILLDKSTGKAVCVIDLDTVMPGLSAYDFGDAIRSGAASTAEDDPCTENMSCRMDMYEAYIRGYLEATRGVLTDEEVRMLPFGARIMTYECGVRFLTDYLLGDLYFHTTRPGQNLDRARTQFRMVEEMDRQWRQMCEITADYGRDTGYFR